MKFFIRLAEFLGLEDSDCSSSEQFRSVRSTLLSTSIKSSDKFLVQLHQYRATSHTPYGYTPLRVIPRDLAREAIALTPCESQDLPIRKNGCPACALYR